MDRQDILRRLKALAFGGAEDEVALAFLDPECGVQALAGRELTLLREIKRTAGGAVEVKLADRAEFIRLLLTELEKDQPETQGRRALLEAMERAAGGGGTVDP